MNIVYVCRSLNCTFPYACTRVLHVTTIVNDTTIIIMYNAATTGELRACVRQAVHV